MKTILVALSAFSIPSVALAAISSPGIYSPFNDGSGAPGTIDGSPGTVAGAVGNVLSFSRNDVADSAM